MMDVHSNYSQSKCFEDLFFCSYSEFVMSVICLLAQINDRYEFPLQLDLDRDGGKYLAPDADRSTRNLYALHR